MPILGAIVLQCCAERLIVERHWVSSYGHGVSTDGRFHLAHTSLFVMGALMRRRPYGCCIRPSSMVHCCCPVAVPFLLSARLQSEVRRFRSSCNSAG
jgi:hypothetical protein